MIDAAVNVSLLAADAAALVFLWKKRDIRWVPGVMVAYGFAVFIGLVMTTTVAGLFGAMRALAWVTFIHGPVLLAGLAALFWKSHRKISIAAAACTGIVALVGIDAFFIEPHWLEVTRVRLSSPKLKRPLRIAIIADVQTDEIGDYERRALKAAVDEKPDLVLFAGDYIQEHDDARRKELNRELRDAVKGMGLKSAIAVEGNCDYEGWQEIFEGTGVTWTRETRTILVEGVQVTALSLMDSEYGDPVPPSSDRYHIVVGHRPDFAMNPAIQADLLVAGHTHGGQVRLPLIGPLITLSRVPRSWAAGVTELPGRTLIVARGIGMERGPAPRLRFLCRPELVIVEVVPSK